MSLEAFEYKVKQDIPLARHLHFSLLSYDQTSLVLSAPYEANRNDKHTVFAGSQASLALLAGWSLASLRFAEQGVSSVAAVKTDMHYIKPIESDFILQARFAEDCDLAHCESSLSRKGRAKAIVKVELFEERDFKQGNLEQLNQDVKASFNGSYFLSCDKL